MTTPQAQSDEIQQRTAALLPYARRFGGKAFLWIGLAQTTAITFFLTISLSLLISNRLAGSFQMGTFEFWRLSIFEIGPLLMVIGSGGLVSAISGLPFGRWAGKAIGIRKRSIAWVGFIAAVVPAILAGLVFVLVALELRPIYFSWAVHSFSADFLLPVFLFSLMYYLPGILTSILAGLVIRQKIRGKEDELRKESGSNDPKDWTAID
ncbi:MAG: hypothetical protein IPP17_09995 [Bacteroidetes bacterium]|nr:hypothetical protein [Bacteroidota bacterium]